MRFSQAVRLEPVEGLSPNQAVRPEPVEGFRLNGVLSQNSKTSSIVVMAATGDHIKVGIVHRINQPVRVINTP